MSHTIARTLVWNTRGVLCKTTGHIFFHTVGSALTRVSHQSFPLSPIGVSSNYSVRHLPKRKESVSSKCIFMKIHLEDTPWRYTWLKIHLEDTPCDTLSECDTLVSALPTLAVWFGEWVMRGAWWLGAIGRYCGHDLRSTTEAFQSVLTGKPFRGFKVRRCMVYSTGPYM